MALEVLRLVLGVELGPKRRLVKFLRVFLFATELGGNRELGHDRVGVELVFLY